MLTLYVLRFLITEIMSFLIVITYILLELFVNYYIHSFQKIFCCENINFIQFFDIFRTYC
jgi:hypothetical protein